MATWNDAVPTASNQVLNDVTAVRQNIDELESVVENLSGLALGTDEPSNWVVLPAKISGLTATATQINNKCATEIAVNNADGSPNISNTGLQFSGGYSDSTWTSIGPTGAGADLTWSDLDSITTSADYIRIAIDASATPPGTPAGSERLRMYARKHGSSVSVDRSNCVLFFENDYGEGTNIERTIPIDSNGVFDLYVNDDYGGTTVIYLYLIASCYNP